MASPETSRNSSNPTSILLQDMLREKKAQTHRAKKSYNAHDGLSNGIDDREVQSSPIVPREKSSAPVRRINGIGVRQPSLPKEMGMKEMEQHLSKINKQNFDLKLEVFHCRQRNGVLEAKVEKLETLEADNAEMQAINEDLLRELEKRDVAVEEAVNLICELEAKIEEMGEAEMYLRDTSRTPQAKITDTSIEDASAAPHNGQQNCRSSEDIKTGSQPVEPPTNPNNLSPTKPYNAARRIPSFLRENKKSTNVLRSLYSYDGDASRPDSVFSGDEEEDYEDGNMLNSPRLSILSEGGFMSIYGDNRDNDRISPRHSDRNNIQEEAPARVARHRSSRDNQREARLRNWIEERNRPSTPTRAPSKSGLNDRFSSIGEVLGKVPSNTEVHELAAENDHPDRTICQAWSPTKSERKEARGHQRRPSSPAFGGPMFGGAMLPPTPGTMSTATIAASSSTPSIITEKSLLDGTPLPAKGYSALIQDARPQTSESSLAIRLANVLAANDDVGEEHESPRSTRSFRAQRPSLTTSATDTVFSGEGFAAIQPSRTLSYPSPTGRARRPSGQLSPTSEVSSGDGSSLRTQKQQNSDVLTPTKRGEQGTQPRSPGTNQRILTPTEGFSKSQAESDPKLGRSTSLRSKINKISLTPSQSSNQSVASRLFRRSNSQTVQAPSDAPNASPPKLPLSRETSSNQHARVPRPSSLYGSSPIYARPGTAGNDEDRSRIPINPRRHSAVVANGGDLMGKCRSKRNHDHGRLADINGQSADEREDNVSRQTVRPEEGKGKWALGRGASARIREGFGFKRSMSTQNV